MRLRSLYTDLHDEFRLLHRGLHQPQQPRASNALLHEGSGMILKALLLQPPLDFFRAP